MKERRRCKEERGKRGRERQDEGKRVKKETSWPDRRNRRIGESRGLPDLLLKPIENRIQRRVRGFCCPHNNLKSEGLLERHKSCSYRNRTKTRLIFNQPYNYIHKCFWMKICPKRTPHPPHMLESDCD